MTESDELSLAICKHVAAIADQYFWPTQGWTKDFRVVNRTWVYMEMRHSDVATMNYMNIVFEDRHLLLSGVVNHFPINTDCIIKIDMSDPGFIDMVSAAITEWALKLRKSLA